MSMIKLFCIHNYVNVRYFNYKCQILVSIIPKKGVLANRDQANINWTQTRNKLSIGTTRTQEKGKYIWAKQTRRVSFDEKPRISYTAYKFLPKIE